MMLLKEERDTVIQKNKKSLMARLKWYAKQDGDALCLHEAELRKEEIEVS